VTGGLPLTGERTVPGIPHENYWFRRHLAVYEAVCGAICEAPSCRGVVLEAGCGEGYGADLLAASAARVLALDYDAQAIGHVGRRYPRVVAARANLVALPVRGAGVDAVVSLQVVEHLWDQPGFLRECARVLAPGGALWLSTPNRLTFSPGRDTPLNPFHTRELSAAELAGLLVEAGFTDVAVLGLHHGPRLRALDVAHGGSLVAAQTAAALAGSWPEALLRDVAAVTTADFALCPDTPDHPVATSLDLVARARARRR
jgi:SAM-dependent methyltransferase